MNFQPVQRITWGINRLLFFFFALMGILTVGVFWQLLAPLYSWYFFKDLNFTRYYRYLYPVMALFFRYSLNGLKNPGYTKIFAVSLFDPPRMDPDHSKLRLNTSWLGSMDDCDWCVNC